MNLAFKERCSVFPPPGLLSAIAVLLFFIAFPTTSIKAADWEKQREGMVREDIKARGIQDATVLEAIRTVPRHLFVPPSVRAFAYSDRPLPIGNGQTISQPYVVALMSQLLDIKQGMKVLEIGTGSGYQAAVLQAMGAKIYSVEIIPTLANRATGFFKKQKIPILVKNSDGYFGWQEYAPFDRIIITAAANHIPPPLLKQLKPGGKLIPPLGRTLFYQTLTLISLDEKGKASSEHFDGVRFVPMTGEAQK